jgi:hypothetical protein
LVSYIDKILLKAFAPDAGIVPQSYRLQGCEESKSPGPTLK